MTRRVLGVAVLVSVAGACRPARPPDVQQREQAGPAATVPATALGTFHGPGVKLTYSGDEWAPTQSDDYVLQLRSRDNPGRLLSLDVPRLPPHIPGLIPLGMVVNGYADDLKKRHPGVRIDEPVQTKVAGAGARRVRSAWEQEGESLVEQAVLTVHDDRVYIFRANSVAADEAAAGAALERVLRSVRWD